MIGFRNATRTRLEERPETGVRPDDFLFPPWRGHGVFCDAFGLPREKYEVHGQGRREADGSVVIEYNTVLDSGLANGFEWVFSWEGPDRFRARDLKTGQTARGFLTPDGFRWEYMLVHKTPLGLRRCRVDVDYAVTQPGEASAAVTISLMGVTVGSASSHIRHVSA